MRTTSAARRPGGYEDEGTNVVAIAKYAARATDKQVAFAAKLLNEKELPEGWDRADLVARIGEQDKRTISKTIDRLLALPKRADGDAPAEATPGYYIVGEDEVYVVVENRAKTHTYAKQLIATPKHQLVPTRWGGLAEGSELVADDGTPIYHVRWDYAPGAGRRLAKSTPLTAKQAARLGHLYGHCIVCCRELTDPKSVEAGIGPRCAKRL